MTVQRAEWLQMELKIKERGNNRALLTVNAWRVVAATKPTVKLLAHPKSGFLDARDDWPLKYVIFASALSAKAATLE